VTYFTRLPKASPSHIGVDGALWFDKLICDLRRSGIVFAVLVVKSVTLVFKGLAAEGAKMDLVIIARCGGSDGTWAETLTRPNKPFKACSRNAFVTGISSPALPRPL
jgi:hypothetical protein